MVFRNRILRHLWPSLLVTLHGEERGNSNLLHFSCLVLFVGHSLFRKEKSIRIIWAVPSKRDS